MRRIAASFSFLLLCLPSASSGALFIGNEAPDPGLGTVRIVRTDSNDELVSLAIEINPHVLEPSSALLDMTIEGELVQVQAGGVYEAVGPDWAPNVFFTSDQQIALALDPTGYGAATQGGVFDTVIENALWPGLIVLDPTPSDGSNSINVAMVSNTGGIGGPIELDEYITLAHVTVARKSTLWIEGLLQSTGDLNGKFAAHVVLPEPTAAALVGLGGLVVAAAGLRRRRTDQLA